MLPGFSVLEAQVITWAHVENSTRYFCVRCRSSATNPHKLRGLKEEAFVLSRCQRPDSRAQQSCSLSEPCMIAQPLTAHSEPPNVHICRYVSFLPSVCPASMKLTEQDSTINIPGESSSGLQVGAARGQGPDSGTRLFYKHL